MKRNRVGRTNVQVTELGFGGAPIGNLYKPVEEATAYAAVAAAWDGGVRYFDTAPHYGLGLSERRLGAALRDRFRGEYVVSAKVGRLLVDNPAPTGSDLGSGGFAVPDTLSRLRDYSRDGVRRSLDASLSRLGLDRVDIVYVHDPEQHMDAAVSEAIPALAELREQGVIGAVGAGMNFVEPLLRLVTDTDLDAVMLAGRWTLADRTGAPLLDACAERGISLVAAAPFNSGLLARPRPSRDTYFDYAPAPPAVLAFAHQLADVCESHHTTLPHAALQYPARHPAVPTVVVGIRTAHQSRANVDWATRPSRPACGTTSRCWTGRGRRSFNADGNPADVTGCAAARAMPSECSPEWHYRRRWPRSGAASGHAITTEVDRSAVLSHNPVSGQTRGLADPHEPASQDRHSAGQR